MSAVAVFPLGAAYLPGERVSLNIFEDRYVSMMTDVMNEGKMFASVLIERGSEVGGDDLRHRHGVIVAVESIVELDALLLVTGVAVTPCDITQWLPDDPYPRAEVEVQKRQPLDEQQRFDIASSLSLLAQAIRLIHESLTEQQGETVEGEENNHMNQTVATIAAGRWWDVRVEEDELWRAFWLLARNLPCGPFDRYSFLTPGSLSERVKRLKQTVEHVGEVVSFRFGQ